MVRKKVLVNHTAADTNFTMSHNYIQVTVEELCSATAAIHKPKVFHKTHNKSV